ncbi:hypothetical protein IGI04_002899 [Brassica rapa subsp. trilocularis]|uniref:Uncharacterized protein n=1 Tax=Brassica rapa subsp. trilocularis TaxID=1813537 RepID=A0ABQ7NWU8_BRACM|nr:hypothetical protein IGI04_002899 [Brassica rapa subsp. trilocularis]
MAATKMFFRSGFEVQMTSMKSRRLRGSFPDDFQKVVWTSWKSSGLHGSLLTKSSFHNRSEHFGFSDLEDFWDDLPKTSRNFSRLLPLQSSGLPESRLDFLKVVWTFWTSSGSRLDFLKVVWAFWKSSDKVLLRFFCNQTKSDDLAFSRLRKQILKSIAKITSALTRRLPAHIRLLQSHIISNESDPPRIVSFYDFMNHKKCKIKILSFFSSMWRESERYVVFSL